MIDSRQRGPIVLAAAAILFAIAWSFGLWLIVLVLVSAAAGLARHRVLARLVALEFVALYERRWALPELLASCSVRAPVEGLFVMPEEEVARSLVTLANRDRLVIRRARRLVEDSGRHARASRRLEEAERLVADGESPPGTRLGAWFVAVAAPAAANGTWWGTA